VFGQFLLEMKTPFLWLSLFLSIELNISATTFIVTNTADSGAGTLRQAILDANANPGADTINFNLPGSGVQTIAPASQLPDITGTIIINGFSQPGSSANTLASGDNSVHLVRLDGFKCASVNPVGLNFPGNTANGSTVRGLVIVRFANAIRVNEASGFTIAGNWIGMDVDGIARGTTMEGIYISSFFSLGYNHVIGGTTPADRNVISGNRYGVWFNGSTTGNSVVQGNLIGTDPTGTLPRGNQFGGVYVFNGTNITVGGPTAAARNIISSATAAGGTGVTVQGGANNLIQGNCIGTDITGGYDLGNNSDGVFVTGSIGTRVSSNEIVNNRANGVNIASSTGTILENNLIGTDATASRPLGNALAGVTISGSTNRVGGLGASQPNTIFFNGGAGVEVTATTAVQNEISGNAIYDNGGLGIDLNSPGINTNDVLDADTGANGLQNYPVLSSAAVTFSALTAQGSLNSMAGANYRLEFFATPSWDPTNIPEGKVFLGYTNVTTDGNGNATFTAAIATTPSTNYVITATATDASGNTSEFSAGVGIVSNGVASPSLVIAQNVSGGGSGSTTTTSITWPSAAIFFSLEKTSSLLPPIQWSPVTSGIVDLSGTKTFTVTNGPNTNEFFRLMKP
jgi:parallel beta-helix repeat protein